MNSRPCSNLKLLIVEDVAVNRFVLLQYLEDLWHIKTDQANNGREAVEMVKNNHYDLILMDIKMPEMDGYEATGIIRGLSGGKYKKVPIIALTSDSKMTVEIRGNNCFDDIITKPVVPYDLYQTIIRYTA